MTTPNTKSFIEKAFRKLDLKSRSTFYNDDELNNILRMLSSEDLNSQILALDIMAGMRSDYIEQLIGRQTNSGLTLSPATSIKWDWAELTEIMLVCYPAIRVNHINGTHLYDNAIGMSGFLTGTFSSPAGWATHSPSPITYSLSGNPRFTHSSIDEISE